MGLDATCPLILDAHGLLTTLADTARNRAGRLAVGKQPRAPVDGPISGRVSTVRNEAQMTHNPKISESP